MKPDLKLGHLTLNMGSLSHAVVQPNTSKNLDLFMTYLSYQSKVSQSKFKPSLI